MLLDKDIYATRPVKGPVYNTHTHTHTYIYTHAHMYIYTSVKKAAVLPNDCSLSQYLPFD